MRSPDESGCIVTLREQASGELRTMHIPGLRRDALRFIARWIDVDVRDWRLLTYSTPHTIATDLAGRVGVYHNGHSPEYQALAMIGRADLLDPSMVA